MSPDLQKLHSILLDVLRKPAEAFTITHPADLQMQERFS